jgi:phosphonate transport system permease protein
MSGVNQSAPQNSPQRAGNSVLAAILSIVIPGAGQLLVGQRGRALALFGSMVVSLLVIWWQSLTGLLVFVAFVWLWDVWDAYNLAKGTRLSYFPALLATLIIIYYAGWIITEIEPAKLFNQANRVAPIVQGMLNPDFLEQESESRHDRAPFEIPCSDNPPSETTNLANGATIILSKTCGEVGDTLQVEGRGFWPDVETELWWANPIGQEQRLTRDGQQIIELTDAAGNFSTEVIVPQAVPLSHETGESQRHAVQINQTRIIGGWQLSTNGALVLEKMAETLAIALMATTFSVVFAVPLSFVAARNLMSGNMVTMAIYYVVRTTLNIVRSIESLIIAIVFVVWVGLGPFAGVMALTVHSIAALGKLYSEQVENIEFGPIDAIRSTGANWYQIVMYAVLPQVVAPFLAFTIYRWDINVRMSTILGFVGGGGIGFLIVQWQRLSEWNAIGAAFWSIMLIVALLDYVSAKARERLA